MKKVLFATITFCSVYAATGQVISAPKGTISKIPRSVSVIVLLPSVVVNRTMDNYPDVSMRVAVSIEDAGEQGYKVNFQSSIPLEKVDINMSEPKQDMNTQYLGAGESSGYFFMDAPVYKGSNNYRLVFYAPGYAKGMWTTMIQRKKS
ncbi:MAG: hypothetical protein ABIU11_02520 [Chitinophagaceae bacterium]